MNFEKEGLSKRILSKFNLRGKAKDLTQWRKLVKTIKTVKKPVKIAVIGKYFATGEFVLSDSYISVIEAVKHASWHNNGKPKIQWIDSKAFEKDQGKLEALKKYNGIIVPGGFGGTGIEGKILAEKYCRENNIPFLGLCYGMQLAVVEFARNVCNLTDANTSEVNPQTPHPVIDILTSQKKLMQQSRYGGTMRLGAYAATLKPGSQVLQLYQETSRLQKDQESVDTIEDFQLIEKIYHHFVSFGVSTLGCDFRIKDILEFLRINPVLLRLNQDVRTKSPEEG